MPNDSVSSVCDVNETVERSSTHTDFADFMKSQESFNTKMMVMLEQVITSKEKEIALGSKNSSDEAIHVYVHPTERFPDDADEDDALRALLNVH